MPVAGRLVEQADEVRIFQNIFNLPASKKVLYILRDSCRNALPLPKSLEDLHRIRCGLLFFQKKMEFNVVICQDDNSATGAGQALKEAGMKEEVKVIGLGGSKDGLQAVKDGVIDGTTYMSAVEEGHLAIETSVKYLNGEKVEPVTEIRQVEVNKDNVDTFKGEW